MARKKPLTPEQEARGAHVRSVMNRHGIRQKHVADYLKHSPGSVGNWFTGVRPMPHDHACAISDHYGFCVYEFYPVNNACKGSTITIKKGEGNSEPEFEYKPVRAWANTKKNE